MNYNRRLLLKGLVAISGTSIMPGLVSQVNAASVIDDPVLMYLRTRAARLADYATFGANEETVNLIMDTGWENWLDTQLSMPFTSLSDSFDIITDEKRGNYFYSPWWTNTINAPDQLLQRVGFALSQWFVISTEHPAITGRKPMQAHYYDMLLKGIDGSFKELLFSVSTHPAMSIYLSSIFNQKADPELGTIPDENYARELLQLFTCGAEKRYWNGTFRKDTTGQKIPNYSEQDVQELARVFTGMGLKDGSRWGILRGDFESPVIEFSEHHDFGSKKLFGRTIPEGLSLYDDIRQALALIVGRRKATTAGNFSRFMIQRLTVSNPRAAYVDHVAKVFKETDGNIKQIVRAIMLHPDAIDGNSSEKGETGRLKEPLLWYSSARRAIAPPRDQLLNSTTGPLLRDGEIRTISTFNQTPLGAPSVFGFFPREFQPSILHGQGTSYIDYVAPEAYLYDLNSIVLISNKLRSSMLIKTEDLTRFYEKLEQGATNEEFADYVLDQILFGNYRQTLKTEMIELLNTRNEDPKYYTYKVRGALLIATVSPDFLVINMPQEA